MLLAALHSLRLLYWQRPSELEAPIPNGLSVPCKYTLISKSGKAMSPALNVPLVPASTVRAPPQPAPNKMEQETIDIKGNQEASANRWLFLFNGHDLTAITTMQGPTE